MIEWVIQGETIISVTANGVGFISSSSGSNVQKEFNEYCEAVKIMNSSVICECGVKVDIGEGTQDTHSTIYGVKVMEYKVQSNLKLWMWLNNVEK